MITDKKLIKTLKLFLYCLVQFGSFRAWFGFLIFDALLDLNWFSKVSNERNRKLAIVS